MLATVARRGPNNCAKSHFFFCIFCFFLKRFFGKIPGFPLKRKLRRAFWPQGLPKAGPRGARGLPRHSLSHLGAQMVVLFGVFICSAKVAFLFSFLFLLFVFCDYFSNSCRLPKAPPDPKDPLGELPGAPKGFPKSSTKPFQAKP
jgi:hypothetical protein